jgi:hypothetical protein
VSTVVLEQAALCDDVAHVWNVVQRNGFGREQRRRHAWQGRVFGATDGDSAVKRLAAYDTKLVHDGDRLLIKARV